MMPFAYIRAADAGEAARALAADPDARILAGGTEGPNLRAVSGRDVAVVAAPEAVAGDPRMLFVWAAGDLLRLAAVNAAALASARVGERTAH